MVHEYIYLTICRASDQGLGTGQVNLADCYEKAIGIQQDATEAVRLYHLAAKQGYATGQNRLGKWYEISIRQKLPICQQSRDTRLLNVD